MTKIRLLFALLAVALFFSSQAAAQVSGQISGTVADSTGAAVVGTKVLLTSDLTKQVRDFTSAGTGDFLFANLVPGTYSLRIEQPGFKVYNQAEIRVAGQEKVDLHEIRLEIGDVSTSIEVTAEASHVATDSSDRTVVVNTRQMEDTPTAGRNFLDVLRTLPGVQARASNDTRGGGAPDINGGRSGTFQLTLDGVTNQDSGTIQSLNGSVSPSVDAIAEVQLLVTNFSAAYGSRNGGQMNVTIKNGTAQFHGSGYYYHRHEMFNANEWFNNKTNVVKPRYRYQNPGGTIGGPVIIPGTNFNRSRTKLFFFYSYDYLHNELTGNINTYTMPTQAERGGDFSQTTTSTGVLIPIIDPTTHVAYPGNKIPVGLISPVGLALMNQFPLPNTTDPTGQRQYNSQFQFSRDQPRIDQILRVDYNISAHTTAYGRLISDLRNDYGFGSAVGSPGANWGQLKTGVYNPPKGFVATVIHTFSPTLVNEFTWGFNLYRGDVVVLDEDLYAKNKLPLKDASGKALSLPTFFNANELKILPNVNLGSLNPQSAGTAITRAPTFGFDSRFPFTAHDTTITLSENLTWIKRKHNVKIGFYWERVGKLATVYSTYNVGGSYYFGPDSANQYDTGYAYSNLLTGAVQAYGEDNKYQFNHSRYNQPEWFVQDTWKIHRRLSLDLGMRFQIIQPTYSEGATLGLFAKEAYDSSKAGQLLFPAVVNGQRVAINPKTNAQYSLARATSFDPASYPKDGTPYSGMVLYDSRFFNTPPVALGPRVGFSWDVFGNGKTAFRGGFGIFYGRPYGADTIAAVASGIGPMAAPPSFQSPVFYNTTFNNLLNTQGFLSPQSVNGGSRDMILPNTYSWSAGIQHNLGKGLLLDVAYVGNVAHHQFGSAIDGNSVAPYTTWTPAGGPAGTPNPAYLDPTASVKTFYSTNLIRSLSGGYNYGAINQWTQLGESNYNALQAQLNRRMGRLQFGLNYTWSKTITFAHSQFLNDQLTKNVVNSPHAVNVNFGYRVPDGSRLVGSNLVSKFLLDGWNFNGLGAFFMGTPLTVGCTATSTPIGYWFGTPTNNPAIRCQMNGNLWLPDGATPASNGSTADPKLWYPFNAGGNLSTNPGFILPSASSFGIGNTPPTLTYGPGFENWDFSVFKSFRLGNESRILTVRAETFNTLNHFNPSNPNSSLTYNYNTGAQTNANFGTITSAQNTSRKMVVSARITF